MIAANAIKVLHIAFAAFMALAPFSRNLGVVAMHAITVPFLLFHWLLNDDTCFLTLVERRLRGLSEGDSGFFHALVSPVYKLPEYVVGKAVWVITILLGCMSWWRAYRMITEHRLAALKT